MQCILQLCVNMKCNARRCTLCRAFSDTDQPIHRRSSIGTIVIEALSSCLSKEHPANTLTRLCWCAYQYQGIRRAHISEGTYFRLRIISLIMGRKYTASCQNIASLEAFTKWYLKILGKCYISRF